MNRPETRYASSDGGYVAFQVFGSGPPTCLFVSNWLQNLDTMWDEPTVARYFERLASFSQVVCFDKRGSGVSDPVPLDAIPTVEVWMDDARLVLDAAGVDEVVVIGDTEGGPMAMTLAASYPDRVTALILINSFPRWARADDYPIGMPVETVERLVDRYEQHWGVTAEILGLTAPTSAGDRRFREWFTRYQRVSMPRGAATAMYRWVTQVDVRPVLPLIRVPTLVLHRAASPHYRAAFGRYLADHIEGATLIEIPGADAFPFNAGDPTPVLDEIEKFLTGTRSEPVRDRLLATILFCDIVDSTGMAARMGDAEWKNLLARHDEVVQTLLARYRGELINETGDGFVAVFDGPARAAMCALHVSRALSEMGIPIRAGIHTGEVELKGDQIAGLAVHMSARVMAEADAGQVLTSSTVCDLVMGSGLEFRPVGRRQLKGFRGEWPLYELVSAPPQVSTSAT